MELFFVKIFDDFYEIFKKFDKNFTTKKFHLKKILISLSTDAGKNYFSKRT